NLADEPEIGRQVSADPAPRVAAVIGAHHIPVLLHEEHLRTRSVHRDPMDAVPDLGVRLGDILRAQPSIYGFPRVAAVVGPKRPRGRDGDEDAVAIAWVQKDRVEAQPAGAWLPRRPG